MPEEPDPVSSGNYCSVRGCVGKYLTPPLFVAGQGKAAAGLPGVRVEYTTPGGFQLVSSYEPRFLPQEPSLVVQDEVDSRRVFGLFLRWERRY